MDSQAEREDFLLGLAAKCSNDSNFRPRAPSLPALNPTAYTRCAPEDNLRLLNPSLTSDLSSACPLSSSVSRHHVRRRTAMADLQVRFPRFLTRPPPLPATIVFADSESFPRFFDPVFAVCVGISAATLRIRREEKEKYPDENNDYGALWAKGVRMGKGYFGGYQDKK
jgi:Non-classical export protein 1